MKPISERTLNLLTAETYPGVGKAAIQRLLHAPLAQILETTGESSEWRFTDRRDQIREAIDSLGNAIDGVAIAGDDDFPKLAGEVKESDRPFALFYKGDLSLLASPERNVALIGMLEPDESILADERRVANELLRQGYCIVSGLARGCDTEGHRAALDANGKTVAILASPLNDITPRSNRALAQEIVDSGGLLVSEYYAQPRTQRDRLIRYIQRDRLQALFSSCVILAASYSKADSKVDKRYDSGSSNALDTARKCHIPRAAIYNDNRHSAIRGYNLNREQIRDGAMPINPDGDLSGLRLPTLLSSDTLF